MCVAFSLLFSIYNRIQQEYTASSPLWIHACHHPKLLRACFSVAQLIVYLSYFEKVCSPCGNNHVHVSIAEYLLT